MKGIGESDYLIARRRPETILTLSAGLALLGIATLIRTAHGLWKAVR